MTRWSVVALLAVLSGCVGHARPSTVLAPLVDEGEVYAYLEPAAEGSRLAFTVDSAEALRADGARFPLELHLRDVALQPRQRLLASGRLPPGEYPALLLTIARATIRSADDRASDLRVPAEPARVEVPLAIARGRATVISLTLEPARSVDASFGFHPSLHAAIPASHVTALSGYCTNAAAANVTVFDKHRHRVVGVLPVGREPRGLALDVLRNRAYVALAGDDQVEMLDLLSGATAARANLRQGDRPTELALTPDGRLLVVLNVGSATVAFVDPSSAIELDRVQVGEDPTGMVLDRSGRRAYALSRRGTITAIDLGTRAVVATARVDLDPLRGQINRAGTRMYLVHAGSPYVSVLSLPDLATTTRVFVGMGGANLKLDARTELLYVSLRDDPVLQVFDPLSLLPVNRIVLPGSAFALALDDQENALVTLHVDERQIAFTDLASRRVVAAVDVGAEPYAVALAGERL